MALQASTSVALVAQQASGAVPTLTQQQVERLIGQAVTQTKQQMEQQLQGLKAEFKQQLQAQQSNIQTLEKIKVSLEESLNAARETLRTQAQTLADLKKQIQQKDDFNQLTSRQHQTQRQMTPQAMALGGHAMLQTPQAGNQQGMNVAPIRAQQVHESTNNLFTLNSVVPQHSEHLEMLDRRQLNVESKIGRLQQAIDSLPPDLSASLFGLNTRMTAFDTWKTKTDQRIEAIEQALDRLTFRVNRNWFQRTFRGERRQSTAM